MVAQIHQLASLHPSVADRLRLEKIAPVVLSTKNKTTGKSLDNMENFEFRGSAKEYFGIWIVNVLLSISDAGDLFGLGEGPEQR